MMAKKSHDEKIIVKKNAATKTQCNCIESVNEQLDQLRGAVVHRELLMNFKTGKSRMSPPLLVVRKSDSKNKSKRLPTVFCTFCPFCGRKYKDD